MEKKDTEVKRNIPPSEMKTEGTPKKRRPRPEGATEGTTKKRRPRPEGATEGTTKKRRPRPEGERTPEGGEKKHRPRPEGEGVPKKRRPRPEEEGAPKKRRPLPELKEPEQAPKKRHQVYDDDTTTIRKSDLEAAASKRAKAPVIKEEDIDIDDIFDELDNEKVIAPMEEKKRKKHVVGMVISLISVMIAGIFYYLLMDLGVVPGKYMTVIAVVLAVLCIVSFALQFVRGKAFILGIIISIFLSLICGVGGYYVHSVTAAMKKVGGATYKTDNMVVIVRLDDPAQNLRDILDYTVGYQTALDNENTKKMKNELRDETDKMGEPQLGYKEYDSLEGLGQALLDGEVGAVIYNEPFTEMIDELIEGYADQVRILYQYGIHTEIEEEKKTGVEAPFNVYISGIDVFGPITSNSRSDVNIIMTVNPDTKQILLTTTPRDYYVPIPGISGEAKDKLTHAGIYGVDRSMATLESIYGIDIQYYARVNFSSLIKIVDVLGGVDVNSEYAFKAGGFSFQQGMNHLTGESALAFARERHSFSAGDNQRGRNQEAVITGMINKALSPAILTNANSLLASVSDSVETNMSQDEMAQLIRRQLDEGGQWTIESVNAVGSGDKQSCYSSGRQLLYVMHPNQDSVNAISEKIKSMMAQ